MLMAFEPLSSPKSTTNSMNYLSERVLKPSYQIEAWWMKRSSQFSSGAINQKSVRVLNHFTMLVDL